MGLKEIAKAEIERITNDVNSGAASPLVFIAPNGTTVNINGLFFERNLEVMKDDGGGNTTNTIRTNATVSEKYLTDAGYPVRNADDLVDLEGHKVRATNSAGIVTTYRISEWKPDQALGVIVCILEV